MDRLWTPWRFDYISTADRTDDECIFCRILSEARDEANFVLHRNNEVFVILNRYPYTSGHILIVANRHISFLEEATDAELKVFFQLARKCEKALRINYHPDGFNMGFNLGKSAGAGVADHLHMHILPRWVGDASFVSVISETRVLPEELPETYKKLMPHFEAANG